MAEFFYTQALDEQKLTQVNLQAMFTNLSAKAVSYTHLTLPTILRV